MLTSETGSNPPRDANINRELATELARLGRFLEAGSREQFEKGINRLLLVHPKCAPAWNMFGVAQKIFGGDSIPAFRQVVELLPDRPEGHKNLGLALLDAGCFDESSAEIERAVSLGLKDAATLNTLGAALLGASKPAAAQIPLEESISLDPKNRHAWVNLCRSLSEQGLHEIAVSRAREALKLLPPGADLLMTLGNSLNASGDFAAADLVFGEAAEYLSQKVEQQGCGLEEIESLADIYRSQGKISNWIKCCELAATRFSDNVAVHEKLAGAYYSGGRIEGAIAAYQRAIEISPSSSRLYSDYLFLSLHDAAISDSELLDRHLEFGRRWCGGVNSFDFAGVKNKEKMLRVGFVSADLRAHAMLSFFEPILDELRKSRNVELHAFYVHSEMDSHSDRISKKFHFWSHVFALSDCELADYISERSIDILVDMSGHSGGNRLVAFGLKPAPIQVSCWGYPATTGIRQMDYYLTDPTWLLPGRYDSQFTESLCHLESIAVFQPYIESPDVSPLPSIRNGYLTIASFNHPRKISRPTLLSWSKLLKYLPDARLIVGGLTERDDGRWLTSELEVLGVSRSRVDIYQRMNMREYLSLHQLADFCINGYPYTGGTTVFHALWMGLPTLTLAGEGPATQTGPSALRKVGLDDWICRSDSELIDKARQIASDVEGLQRVRQELRNKILDSTMGPARSAKVATDLEIAFRKMWVRFCDGQPPSALNLASQNPHNVGITSFERQ